MQRTIFARLVVRSLVLGHIVIGCMLWSAWSNRSLALQEANTQCEYGTNALNADTGAVTVVPTFHSLGVYWTPSGRSPAKTAHVLFGEVGSTEDLRRSLDLVYSSDDNEYRGSVVHLKSGTEYEIAFFLDGSEIETVIGGTWCEQFPIAETVIVPTGMQTEPYKISGVVGSPDGYILYTADPDSFNTLNGESVANNIMIENSAYVIVRGLTMKNAERDAILITGRGNTHDIVIEDNVIENWGRINAVSGFGENDAAIRTANGDGINYERLIIQRNIINNPRGDANSWVEYREDGENCTVDRCHPKGPGGLFFKQTAGNHVIRYNEISSTNGNYFNDGIGGAYNFDLVGNLNKDSDVYGNIVMNVWDDAIEIEGGNMNIRIWGNYIDNTYVAFGIAAVSRGPLYIFRNVVYRTQRYPDETNNAGVFIKNQMRETAGGGHVFVFHNTVYRYNEAGGVMTGISGTSTPLVNFMSRNNIIDASNRVITSASSNLTVTNDIDYDLYQGTIKNVDGQEQHGIEAAAVFGNDPSSPYALANGNLGHDDGIVAPNFSDNAVGAPDMGAQEYGAPPLEFGTTAYQTEGTMPVENLPILINAAATDEYVDALGRIWEPDRNWLGENKSVNRGDIAIANTEDDHIYQLERYCVSGYRFAVEDGDYVVKLHFAETYEGREIRVGARVFDVDVEGVLLKNLDVYAEAGFATSLVKIFDITVIDGELNIGFFSNQGCGYVMINGIEVLAGDAKYGGNQVPEADLSLACVDLNCRFADQSIDADGTVVSWSWNFGDGSGSTLQNPSHGYSSADKFTVTLIVTDDDGATSEPASHRVSVSDPAINQPPMADDKTVTTNEDTAVSFVLTGSDAEGVPLTFAVASGPANGSLSGSSPNLIYTPNAGYIGPDSLTYTANDGTVDSAPATVSITVAAVDEVLTITGISPNSVQTGTTLEALIRGTSFADDAQIRFDQGSGRKPKIISVVVEDSKTLRALIKVKNGSPKRKRSWDVIVTSGGSTAILEDGLTVVP